MHTISSATNQGIYHKNKVFVISLQCTSFVGVPMEGLDILHRGGGRVLPWTHANWRRQKCCHTAQYKISFKPTIFWKLGSQIKGCNTLWRKRRRRNIKMNNWKTQFYFLISLWFNKEICPQKVHLKKRRKTWLFFLSWGLGSQVVRFVMQVFQKMLALYQLPYT